MNNTVTLTYAALIAAIVAPVLIAVVPLCLVVVMLLKAIEGVKNDLRNLSISFIREVRWSKDKNNG